LQPANAAQMAKMGTTSIGKSGCMDAFLTSNNININSLTAGTYVCVKTSEGRYAEFRVNSAVGPSPGTLRITYTTWQTFFIPGIIIVTPFIIITP
jgi:hypothetical protein